MAELYLVWSNEHGAWWGPARTGYVQRIENAGTYTHEQALQICTDAMPGTSARIGMLPEIPVRLADLEFMLQRFAGSYPGHDAEPPER
jgi:hypothetical protein